MSKLFTPDMCKCCNCEGVFKVKDCPTDYGHHDGWEMPTYTEILCPVCDDGGCVDDFFFSVHYVKGESIHPVNEPLDSNTDDSKPA